MNTSSLHMIGPYRRRLFEIKAQMSQAAMLENKIQQRKQLIVAACVMGAVLSIAAFFWFIAASVDQEGQRMDTQHQIWRSQGFPIPSK